LDCERARIERKAPGPTATSENPLQATFGEHPFHDVG
jgi:hypothetical protein